MLGYAFNAQGQTAFVATVGFGSEITGLWVAERGESARLIVHSGEVFQIAPGDLRTIDGIELIDFNDNAQALLEIQFTDHSQGLYLVTIPQPATAFFAMAGAAYYLSARRRTLPH